MNFFKLILIMIFAYFIYNVIKFVMQVKANLEAQQKRMETQRKENLNRKNSEKNNGKTIELDKNQYKVE